MLQDVDRHTYLQKQNTDALRGILAVLVLTSHIYVSWGEYFSNTLIHFIFYSLLGYLPVSIFFFLSGYGLSYSYRRKKSDYVKNFLSHRLVPFYVKHLCIVAVYLIMNLVLNEELSFMKILKSLLIGGTIVKFGWYFQTQLVLYLLFYIIYRSSIRKKLAWFGVSFAVLFAICCAFNLGSATWWITSPVFLVGLIWGTYAETFECILRKYWGAAFVICIIMTGLAWKISVLLPGRFSELSRTFTSAILLTIAFVSLLKIVSVSCKITQFLGRLSLEIYAMQGIAFIIAGRLELNFYLYVGMIVVTTLVLAICLHWLFNIAVTLVQKYLQSK